MLVIGANISICWELVKSVPLFKQERSSHWLHFLISHRKLLRQAHPCLLLKRAAHQPGLENGWMTVVFHSRAEQPAGTGWLSISATNSAHCCTKFVALRWFPQFCSLGLPSTNGCGKSGFGMWSPELQGKHFSVVPLGSPSNWYFS